VYEDRRPEGRRRGGREGGSEEGREGGTWMFSKCSVVLASSTAIASSKMTSGSRTKRWEIWRESARSTPPASRRD
jgi:hypothetical protein